MNAQLTERQRLLLVRVVEEYVASRQPVGSKTLVQIDALSVSPSTVRAELAELERLGLLTHPHTSAGRIPTETGLPDLRRRPARHSRRRGRRTFRSVSTMPVPRSTRRCR